MRNPLLGCIVAGLVLSSTSAATEDRYIDAAKAAARWIAASTIDAPQGATWPADPRDAKTVDRTLYTGSPGPVLFFLELYRETRDDAYLKSARAGAEALLASLDPEKSTGLYTGIAGVGFTLGETYRVTGDRKYLAGAKRAVDRLRELGLKTGRGVQWNDVTDVIAGSSGTGLFLLWAARELAMPEARDLAIAAGHRLIELGQSQAGGGLKWMMDPKSPRELPNFSHGTAGVAYFLATLYQETKQKEFLDAARAGARYLLLIADVDSDACVIYHNDTPEGRKLYYLSWCHGPAGTARLFYRLHQVTGDKTWMQWFNKAAHAVVEHGGPEKVVTPGAWDNVSVCCGITGQAQFFLNVYEITGEKRYYDLARRATDLLLQKATRDSQGMRWVQAEHRVRPDLLVAQTGYMQGASGIGLWLLHMGTFEDGKKRPKIVFPDNPFRF